MCTYQYMYQNQYRHDMKRYLNLYYVTCFDTEYLCPILHDVFSVRSRKLQRRASDPIDLKIGGHFEESEGYFEPKKLQVIFPELLQHVW
jgi:hypothetical protein